MHNGIIGTTEYAGEARRLRQITAHTIQATMSIANPASVRDPPKRLATNKMIFSNVKSISITFANDKLTDREHKH